MITAQVFFKILPSKSHVSDFWTNFSFLFLADTFFFSTKIFWPSEKSNFGSFERFLKSSIFVKKYAPNSRIIVSVAKTGCRKLFYINRHAKNFGTKIYEPPDDQIFNFDRFQSFIEDSSSKIECLGSIKRMGCGNLSRKSG